MSKLLKYRIKCTTDNVDEYWWLSEGDPAPTTCPTDSAHTVNGASVAVVDRSGPNEVEVAPKQGGLLSMLDGVTFSGDASKTHHAEYSVPFDLHLQGTMSLWKNLSLGDVCHVAIIHPGGQTNLASASLVNDTTVTVGTGKGAYYDPTQGAVAIEFWNAADDALLETVEIDSVAGDAVTLKSALALAHGTDEIVRVSYGCFSPIRGTEGLDGGVKLLGDGSLNIINQNQVTEKIAAGLQFSARCKTTAAAGLREIAVNFWFRRAQ